MSGDRLYQTLTNYDGGLSGLPPSYNGVEYDYEIPSNLVIGSPGGVSTIHHHWTKGFDGRGNTSSDIYAGQSQRYISGEYGNMYQTGQSASQAQGMFSNAPDYQFWRNQQPQQYAYSHSEESQFAPNMSMYGEAGAFQKKGQNFEQFTYEDDFELISPSDDVQKTPLKNIQSQLQNIEDTQQQIEDEVMAYLPVPSIPPWTLFLFFLIAFIAFDFWAEAGRLFVQQHIHKGQTITWQRTLLYAVIITAVFALVIWMAGVPITTFEGL